MKIQASLKNMVLPILLVIIFPMSYASSQSELLNAQDNYQTTRNQYIDAKKQVIEAKKELTDAQKLLADAQTNLKLKQNNLANAKISVINSGKAFTAATAKVNSVWDGDSSSTKTSSKTAFTDNSVD